jgi:peptidoglycan DL-endopeptidase LytE
MKTRNLAAVLALGALTALPACSSGGGSSTGSYSQSSTVTPPGSYGTASSASSTGTSGNVAPVSPDMIRQVQTTLKQNGDYKARVDGVWGPMTESGVRTWQQAHNLTTNGEIDTATLQSMNIPTGSQANNQPGQTNNNGAAATQPTGNQNYSTGANNPAGSSYSSNNSQPPANRPAPTNQGTASTNDNGAAGNALPNATGNTSH